MSGADGTTVRLDPDEARHAGHSASGSTATLPERFGAYVTERLLARGGMGAVLVVRHETLGQRYALKLASDVTVSPDVIARFQREIAALAALGHHPNVVGIHASGIEAGHLYYVMDLIEGTPLDQVLEKGALDPIEAARIGADVARALHFAHGNGILHRDVKPSNVLLDKERRGIVFDFGLAFTPGDRLTRTGEILGTPAYMAPEQALGERDKQGAWTDVYAVGALVYEAATGHRPFEGKTGVAASLAAAIQQRPKAPRQWRTAITPELEHVIMKCLEKDPLERYPDARSLELELTAIAEHGEGEAAQTLRARRRSRIRTGGWAVLLGLTGVSSLELRAHERRPRAEPGYSASELDSIRTGAQGLLVATLTSAAKFGFEPRWVRHVGGADLAAEQASAVTRAIADVPGNAPMIDVRLERLHGRARLVKAVSIADPKARVAELEAVVKALGTLEVPERVLVVQTYLDSEQRESAVREVSSLLMDARVPIASFTRILQVVILRAGVGRRAGLVMAAAERRDVASLDLSAVVGGSVEALLEQDRDALEAKIGERLDSETDESLKTDHALTLAAIKRLTATRAPASQAEDAADPTRITASSGEPTPAPTTTAPGDEPAVRVNHAYLVLCRDSLGLDPERDRRVHEAVKLEIDAVIARTRSERKWPEKKARVARIALLAREQKLDLAERELQELKDDFGRAPGTRDVDESTPWAELEVALARGALENPVVPPLEVGGGMSSPVFVYLQILVARAYATRAFQLRAAGDARASAAIDQATQLIESAPSVLDKAVAAGTIDKFVVADVKATVQRIAASWRER